MGVSLTESLMELKGVCLFCVCSVVGPLTEAIAHLVSCHIYKEVELLTQGLGTWHLSIGIRIPQSTKIAPLYTIFP